MKNIKKFPLPLPAGRQVPSLLSLQSLLFLLFLLTGAGCISTGVQNNSSIDTQDNTTSTVQNNIQNQDITTSTIDTDSTVKTITPPTTYIKQNTQKKEIEKAPIDQSVFLKLQPRELGYLNGPSVKDKYTNTLKGKNDFYHITYDYTESFTSVSDSLGATSLVGQLVVKDTDDVISSEVYIAKVEQIKALAPYKDFGLEFLINVEYQESLKNKKMYNDPTQILSDFYIVETDEYSGYAYDNTKNRLQHVGLPTVTTTMVTAIVKNKFGEAYKLGIVGAHDDGKLVLETLKF